MRLCVYWGSTVTSKSVHMIRMPNWLPECVMRASLSQYIPYTQVCTSPPFLIRIHLSLSFIISSLSKCAYVSTCVSVCVVVSMHWIFLHKTLPFFCTKTLNNIFRSEWTSFGELKFIKNDSHSHSRISFFVIFYLSFSYPKKNYKFKFTLLSFSFPFSFHPLLHSFYFYYLLFFYLVCLFDVMQ